MILSKANPTNLRSGKRIIVKIGGWSSKEISLEKKNQKGMGMDPCGGGKPGESSNRGILPGRVNCVKSRCWKGSKRSLFSGF